MSAPDTNLKKQKRWHRGPLIWMAVAIVLAFAVAVGIMLFGTTDEGVPGSQISGEDSRATDISEGDIDLPEDAPTDTVDSADPDVDIVE